MKIIQTYTCGEDKITVRYTVSKIGLIVDLEEVAEKLDNLIIRDEVTMPKLEVTPDCFRRILNNHKLR